MLIIILILCLQNIQGIVCVGFKYREFTIIISFYLKKTITLRYKVFVEKVPIGFF